MIKKTFCIANWKMYMNKNLIDDFFYKYNQLNLLEKNTNIIICPSDIHIEYLNSKYDISIGSQNVSHFKEGPFTGEISIKMLDEQNILYSITVALIVSVIGIVLTIIDSKN